MKLFSTSSSSDDYVVKKILATAAVAGVDIEESKVSENELVSLHSGAVSTVLEISAGKTVSQHIPILKEIAQLSPASGLNGGSNDSSKVDQWLDFSWHKLEVPIQVLLALEANNLDVKSDEEKNKIILETKNDIFNALKVVEDHLVSSTYFAGERMTLADISIFSAISAIEKLSFMTFSASKGLSAPSRRWFYTVASNKNIVSVFQVSSIPSPSSSDSTMKWDRCRIRIKELIALGANAIGKDFTLKGWIRTVRTAEKGTLIFVELNDGSSVKGMQLVFPISEAPTAVALTECGGVGASISVKGTAVESPAAGQLIEIKGKEVEVLGAVYGGDNGTIGGKNYPMAKKAHTLEYMREKAHLRPRSKMFSSAMRMRHAMAFATHQFFNNNGFVYVHTPLITGADCEGAGEMFTCTTLLPESGKLSEIPLTKKGDIDYSKDFFGRKCGMTVSGQLNVETHACALSDVYTFGPTFRAENSHTSRHLAEFWMIEPEISFADLGDDMALAEDYIRFCAKYALENCADDINYFENEYPAGEKGLRARLQNVVDNDFARITYTDAVELLQKEIAEKRAIFERYPNWGDDLGSEHERYLTEKIYQKPTIVINYPKGIKAFYMKLNDDNETVAAMDILVPKIGELVGGAQREDRADTLLERAKACGIEAEDIWWYADLRRYGTVPHAGFGLGFERLVMFVTGLENIRDVIPFPRVPGKADF